MLSVMKALPNLQSANADTVSGEFGSVVWDEHMTDAEFYEEAAVAGHVASDFAGIGYENYNEYGNSTTNSIVTSYLSTFYDAGYVTNFWLGDEANDGYGSERN